MRTAAADHLQQDIWTLWRAVGRLSDHAKAEFPGFATTEILADCLSAPASEIADTPGRLAILLKAHEGLSALVYPATPDSIRLSEAYEGAPPPSTSQGRGLWSAWRHAFRLRWIFRVFTVVSLFVLCMAVLISMQAAIGYALLRDAKVAIKEARALRVQNATTLPRSALDESGQTTRQKEADTTALMTSDRLRDWITSPVVYLLTGRRIPEFHVEEGRMADPTLPTAAEADLTLMTTILLPILGGFLGAYCEFVRWFTRRQLAMMMTSGDGMQIAVRFMLALVVTVIVAMISQAIPLGQLTSFLPFIFAFIVGYLASHLFSALDTLITAPSSIVLAQRVERATRNVIEQTQATQITAFKGSVEEVIGRTLGVPNVVNYAGQIGVDLRDEGEHSVLEARAANATGSVSAILIAGATYTLLIVIGRSIENLPIVEDLSVKDGEEAVDVSFEIEVESALLPSRRAAESGTPTDKEPWTHRFTLRAPEPQGSTKTEQIWVTVRQRGITYQSIAILAKIVPPEGGGLQQ